jgi:hypothetical protein
MVEPPHQTIGGVGYGNSNAGHHMEQAFVTEWILLVGKSLHAMGHKHGSR